MHRLITMVALLSACGTPPAKNGTPNSTANNVNSMSNNSTVVLNNVTTGDRIIRAADYEQSCEYDGDCAVVHEGDACLCGGSACGNAAVSQSDLEAFRNDRDALCPSEDLMCSAAPCEEILPVCVDGACGVREPVYVDPVGLETSCEVDEDCTVVVGGEVCSACRCGGTAVNAQAAEEYLSMFEPVDCVPGPDFCDCATIDSAWCNDGACEVGVAP